METNEQISSYGVYTGYGNLRTTTRKVAIMFFLISSRVRAPVVGHKLGFFVSI